MPRATWRRTSSRRAWLVSYAIGVAKPTSIMATTFGTGKISDEKIEELIARHFDLRPKGIVQMLDLLRPIYRNTAAYGHFGSQRADLQLGEDGQGRGTGCGCRHRELIQEANRRGALQRPGREARLVRWQRSTALSNYLH